ncbi:hypothetical protein UlMin_042553 [Ulmus minor]
MLGWSLGKGNIKLRTSQSVYRCLFCFLGKHVYRCLNKHFFAIILDLRWAFIDKDENCHFLIEKHMEANFDARPQPWVTNITVDDIHYGDFLAISKILGRWGGFKTLEKWVSGAYAGHTAICLKDSEGKLWVGKSRHENDEGEDIIVILPWDEWWEFELNKDDSNPHIALLPLHPDMRAKFNETAAWEYAKSMDGMPYGYHNMIFIWNQRQPSYAANMWNEALNKRLRTNKNSSCCCKPLVFCLSQASKIPQDVPNKP